MVKKYVSFILAVIVGLSLIPDLAALAAQNAAAGISALWSTATVNEGGPGNLSGVYTNPIYNNQYTVTFNSNGGSTVNPVTKYYSTVIGAPKAPTKSGYTFAGWYTDNNTFKNHVTFPYTITKNITLYAKWGTFNSNDLSKIKSFLKLPSNISGLTNAQALGWDVNDPSSWNGITWNTDSPMRISGIIISSKNLSGSLDVSGFTKLQLLNCSNNAITQLNVNGDTALDTLYCRANYLMSLDVSTNTALVYLYCNDDQSLDTLDVSKNVKLLVLNCNNCNLSALDVSKNTQLYILNCYSNHLSNLNISSNILMEVHASNNPITDVQAVIQGKKVHLHVNGHAGVLDDLNFLIPTYFSATADTYSNIASFKNWTDADTGEEYSESKYLNLYSLNKSYNLVANFDIGDIDTNDFSKLQTFLKQPSAVSGKTNAQQLGWDANDPTTWSGVSWNDASPNRISSISTNNEGVETHNLAGTLDVSDFAALKYLYCSDNQISSINVSGDINLNDLYCESNPLGSLDVSTNTGLSYLGCVNDQLTTLDVSNNIELEYLGCSQNNLKELDLSQNTNLNSLVCSNNQLTTLDVSNNRLSDFNCSNNDISELKTGNKPINDLDCSNNRLTSLNLNASQWIWHLDCHNNQLTSLTLFSGYDQNSFTIDCSNNKLQAIDLSNYTLDNVTCTGNPMTDIKANVKEKSIHLQSDGKGYLEFVVKPYQNIMYANTYQASTYLFNNWTSGSKVVSANAKYNLTLGTAYDLTANYKPNSLDANKDGYIDPDFNKLQAFLNKPSAAGETNGQALNSGYDPSDPATWTGVAWTNGYVSGINWESKDLAGTLDVSGCTGLNSLDCSGNGLTSVNTSGDASLTGINCGNNLISSLNITGNTSLTELDCSVNKITGITGLAGCKQIKNLFCNNNNLASLDASGLTKLVNLDVSGNKLTSLKTASDAALQILTADDNNLAAVDLAANTALQDFSCRDNRLSTVTGLANCKQLKSLDVTGNNLASLSTSGLTKLESLACGNNKLTSMNVSTNTALKSLSCELNTLTALDASKCTAITDLSCGSNLLREIKASINGKNIHFKTPGGGYIGLTKISDTGNEAYYVQAEGIPSGLPFLNWTDALAAVVSTDGKMDLAEGTAYDLTANFNPTVTFKTNGSPAIDPVKPAYNSLLVKPKPDPVLNGYTFSGWYNDSAFKTAWNFSTDKVTKNITLYAKWTPKTYTITFNSMKGTAVSSKTGTYNKIIAPPANPTKSGYGFSGWFKDQGCTAGNEWNFSTDLVTGPLTLYAAWMKGKYTVTFNSAGGSYVDKQIVNLSSAITQPNPAPKKDGYKFAGWFKDSACTTGWNFAKDKVTASLTLYTKWQPIVTFDSQGGSAVGSIAANPNSVIKQPATSPTVKGYTFAGWYKEPGCVNAWNFAKDTVKGPITLYAKWKINSYTVTFNSQGGNAVASASVKYNTAVKKPADPAKKGYTFSGWYREAACRTPWNFASDTVQGATTLYARWLPVEYKITYNSQGGSGVAGDYVDYNSTIPMPASPAKAGYMFGGWYKEAACTNIWNFLTDKVTGTRTLYAKWVDTAAPTSAGILPASGTAIAASTFTMTANSVTDLTGVSSVYFTVYNRDAGPIVSVNFNATNKSGNWSATCTLSSFGYKNGTYVINAWGKDTKGNTGLMGSTEVTVSDTVYPAASSITPADNATITTPTFKVAANNVSDQTGVSNVYFTVYNQSKGSGFYKLYTSAKSGSNWTATVNMADFGNTNGTYVINAWGTDLKGNCGVMKSITLNVAVPIPYTVTFYSQGGSPVAAVTAKYGTTIAQPANPTRPGYVFGGWFGDSACTDQWDFSGDKVMGPTGLYAKWTPASYAVTFDSRGGSDVMAGSASYNGLLDQPDDPVLDGYDFSGWFKEVGCITPWNFAADKVKQAITLYAKWTVNTAGKVLKSQSGKSGPVPAESPDENLYAVTFDSRGGSGVQSQTVAENSPAVKPDDPKLEGYTFGGWYTDKECTDENAWDFAAGKVTGATTLYAKWTADTYTVTFDSQGGSGVQGQTVAENSPAVKPDDPKLEGYTFGGWYTDKECTDQNAWDFAAEKVTGATTLYAKWTADTYAVTFDSQNGSGVQSQTIAYNAFAAKPDDPKLEGYTFGGWYTDKECTDQNAWNFAAEKVTGAITLYAKWMAV